MTYEKCKHWEISKELEHYGRCDMKKFLTHRDDELRTYGKRIRFGELFEIAKGEDDAD